MRDQFEEKVEEDTQFFDFLDEMDPRCFKAREPVKKKIQEEEVEEEEC